MIVLNPIYNAFTAESGVEVINTVENTSSKIWNKDIKEYNWTWSTVDGIPVRVLRVNTQD